MKPIAHNHPTWQVDDDEAERTTDGPAALLRTIAKVAWGYRLPLGLWTLACAVVAALYSLSVPPTYTASATLLLEPRRSVATSGREQVTASSLDLNRADSEVLVIRSERLLSAVFEGLDLANVKELQPQPPGLLRRIVTSPMALIALISPASTSSIELAEKRARQSAFENFGRRLLVRRVGQSFAIEISYSSEDPDMASRVANASASAYILQSVSFKADSARSGAEYIQYRLDSLASQVEAATRAVKEGKLPARPTPDADGRVIGAALPPLGPSAPQPKLLIALGIIFGLTSGLVAIALREAMDERIRTLSGFGQVVGLRCIAAIPDVWRGLPFSSASPNVANLAVSEPNGRFAASIRQLRDSIDHAIPVPREKGVVIALIGMTDGIGVRTLAINLASLMIRSGRSAAVLPDGPALEFEGFDRSSLGLPSAVVEATGDREKLTKAFVADARAEGDVVIDLPSLDESTAALRLLPQADLVVLVVQAGRSTAEEIVNANSLLRRAGANVVGAVINRVRG